MIERRLAASLGWRVEAQRCVWESRWHRLHEDVIRLPNGSSLTYSYVGHPGAVLVVPQVTDGPIALVRCYRYTIDQWSWEVPAGTLADQPGMPPEEVARRELQEEIGGTAEEMISLGTFFMGNGFARYNVHLFVATGVRLSEPERPGDGEVIDEIRLVDIADALAMIARGEIHDGESALALYRAAPIVESRHLRGRSEDAP